MSKMKLANVDDRLLSVPEVTVILQRIVDDVARQVDFLYPNLKAMERGTLIDNLTRERVANTPALAKSTLDGKVNKDPDLMSPLYPNVWWDMSTQNSFERSKWQKYAEPFGPIGILLDTHSYKVENAPARVLTPGKLGSRVGGEG